MKLNVLQVTNNKKANDGHLADYWRVDKFIQILLFQLESTEPPGTSFSGTARLNIAQMRIAVMQLIIFKESFGGKSQPSFWNRLLRAIRKGQSSSALLLFVIQTAK